MNIFYTFAVVFLDGPGEAASKPAAATESPPPTKAPAPKISSHYKRP
jgi:hypothetical protein